jgi:UDPglucose--hexose-1-phosphate uridylyltransferase
MKRLILGGVSFSDSEICKKHAAWFDSFKNNYIFTEENTEDILKREIAKTFVKVLCDAGVYKDNENGKKAFLKFIDAVNTSKSK